MKFPGNSIIPYSVRDPCSQRPCGPNSLCESVGHNFECKCLKQFVGSPPNCRPECVQNGDCPHNLACVNNICKDPCQNACGNRAVCLVKNHSPVCTCEEEFAGNPYVNCQPVQSMSYYFQ